jgi:CBS domain-containing protein
MTALAITISPDATIPAAARIMTTRHIRRLPVAGPDGHTAAGRFPSKRRRRVSGCWW